MLIFDNVNGQTTQTKIPDKRTISFTLKPGQIGVLYGSGERACDYLLLAAGRGVMESGAIYLEINDVKKIFDISNAHLKDPDISWRRIIGHCGREDGLLSNLTLLENLELPFEYHGAQGPTHPHDALTFFNIPTKFWDQRPSVVPQEIIKHTLMARSIVGNAQLLLWESPCTNIPWEKWGGVVRKILELKSQGKSILISCAEAPVACALADWVLYLKDNQLFEDGNSFFTESIRKITEVFMSCEGLSYDG